MSKKISIVSSEFPPGPGGVGCHAFHLADKLFKFGWDVQVITEQNYTDSTELKIFNKSQDFKVINVPSVSSRLTQLKKVLLTFISLLQHRPSLIVGTGTSALNNSSFFSKLFKSKLVLLGHGIEFGINQKNNKTNVKHELYENSDKIIFVSEFTRSVAKKNNFIIEDSIVIHNGGDSSIFKVLPANEISQFKKFKNIENQKIILTIGGVHERKGQEWIIRAMPEILKKVPNAHYYCIGLGVIKEKLENLANELNLNSRVHFLGRLEDEEMILWLNASDVFGMTSVLSKDGDFEGFGIAIIEAAMCGKPAVVSDASGVTEAVVNGETGLVSRERDSYDISEKICELLQDDSLRLKIGNAAFERASTLYTWEAIIKKYDTELLALLD